MNLLERVEKLEKEASEFGFQWEVSAQIMEQIKSECFEIAEHLEAEEVAEKEALQEEVGDLLHAVFSLCVFLGFSPEETLEKTLAKFERRLQAVKDIAKAKGLSNLKGHSFEALMVIWQEAKKKNRKFSP